MRIAIAGAGIIGASTALALAARGHQVIMFDRSGGADSAARGNAGAFAFPEIIPLATPGIWRKVPRWLLDPDGPLSVPAGYGPRLLPWLLRFCRASLPDRYRAAVQGQIALMDLSRQALDRLVVSAGLAALLRHEGQLQLFDTEASFRASLPDWRIRAEAGISHDLVQGTGALAEIQPGLSPRFAHGVWTPGWSTVSDPATWSDALLQRAMALGAELRPEAVHHLSQTDSGVEVTAASGTMQFDRAVIAAGAWSRPLARTLGLRLPLETERGYNTTLPAGAFDLRTFVTFADHGFVASRIGDGVRVGGAVELGGLRRPPRMSRADTLLRKGAEFLPGLVTSGGTQWMGYRPSMPDSLPVIGTAPAAPRVVLAFGHGHLGLTQSAGTAELVADLIDERPPAIDLAPYRPNRFLGAGG